MQGFLRPGEASKWFTNAAEVFSEDVRPSEEELRQRGGWSAINTQLWAKYFKGKALVAKAVENPTEAVDLLVAASNALRGTESGWVDPRVSRFRILVKSLSLLVGGVTDVTFEEVHREFCRELRMSGLFPEDRLHLQFITIAGEALAEFREDPARAMTSGRLPIALEILRRMPLVGEPLTQLITPAVGKHALVQAQGQTKTWVARELEGIVKEDQLRRITLRLLQSRLPIYAQIRHGPLEYGKDIVSVIEEKGQIICDMYQVKVGNIDTPTWRAARAELEEMFLIRVPLVQIGTPIDCYRAYLLCNGHVNSYVEPLVESWIKEQRTDHDRRIELVHLDTIVKWIFEDRLVNEFRLALQEIEIK